MRKFCNVGAVTDRPCILPRKMPYCRFTRFFPYGKPEKCFNFRRAVNDRPYEGI